MCVEEDLVHLSLTLPFCTVSLPFALSNSDTMSDICGVSRTARSSHAGYRPRGRLAPSPAAAHQAKAFQRDASVSSPYLLGRAPCDGGLRLAGSCLFSWGERWERRAAAGSASAAGSAEEVSGPISLCLCSERPEARRAAAASLGTERRNIWPLGHWVVSSPGACVRHCVRAGSTSFRDAYRGGWL